MVVWTRSSLTHGLAVSVLCACAAFGAAGNRLPVVSPDAAQARAEYQDWITRYGRKDLSTRTMRGPTNHLKLVVTSVTGDEHSGASRASGIVTTGSELSADGRVSTFYRWRRGSKGSSGGQPIPESDMKRLDNLLAKLPNDGSRLPPAGRRMLLQAMVGGRLVSRVYDRANTPDEVWEILRLSHCGIGPWVPTFKPQTELEAHLPGPGGFLCLSPDRRQILFTSGNGPLQFWEPTTHELLAEVRRLPEIGQAYVRWDGIAFSPDASLAAVTGDGECLIIDASTWKGIRKLQQPRNGPGHPALFQPQFTPDGRYLLMQSSEPALRIFDTTTWERVERLPDLPEDAVQYFPAPKRKRALVRSRNGSLLLWDLARHRAIARLDDDVYISQVAFAPDESKVAVATSQTIGYGGYWGNPRIRVWDTKYPRQ